MVGTRMYKVRIENETHIRHIDQMRSTNCNAVIPRYLMSMIETDSIGNIRELGNGRNIDL